MATTKYLDSTGLSYLWTKITNKISAVFAYKKVSVGGTSVTAKSGLEELSIAGSGKTTVALTCSTTGDGKAIVTITSPCYLSCFGESSASTHFTCAEKTKLGGIAPSAEVNQNAFSKIAVKKKSTCTGSDTEVCADSKTDTLKLYAGTNIVLVPDATNGKITICATGVQAQLGDGCVVYIDDTDSKLKIKNDIGVEVTKIIAACGDNVSILCTAVDNGSVPSVASTRFMIAHHSHTNTMVFGSTCSSISNPSSATTNTTTFLNLTEDGAKKSPLKITGSGATSVSANGNVLTITSTDNDTKNTAGSTTCSGKLYIIGAKSTGSSATNPQTYSNSKTYASSGKLYSNCHEVVTLSDTQTMTNKTLNITNVKASATPAVTCWSQSLATTCFVQKVVSSAVSGAPHFQGTISTNAALIALNHYNIGDYWIIGTAFTSTDFGNLQAGDWLYAIAQGENYNKNDFTVVQTDMEPMSTNDIDGATDGVANS